VLAEEAMINSEVIVEAPRSEVFERMLEPKVMERYLFADSVDVVPGARGETLGGEFHCHHGGAFVTMRVVSIEPEKEMTLAVDQPTDGYVTTRLIDAGEGRTSVQRAFLWELPADPELAASIREMLESMVTAGEGAIKAAFETSPPSLRDGTSPSGGEEA
jgi:uncharacterized protein YndB with AHSA1/START domain